jgi:hypothetical protein
LTLYPLSARGTKGLHPRPFDAERRQFWFPTHFNHCCSILGFSINFHSLFRTCLLLPPLSRVLSF